MKCRIGFTKPAVKRCRFGLVNVFFIINLRIAQNRDVGFFIFVVVNNLSAFIGILNAVEGECIAVDI